MTTTSNKRKTRAAVRARRQPTQNHIRLRLYVAGATPRSMRAVVNLKTICDAELAGRCELEIVDIYQQPKRAKLDQVIAVPTLVILEPAPARKVTGDLLDSAQLRAELGL